MGKNPSEFKGDKRPVDSVLWNDNIFCEKLTEIGKKRIVKGMEYRLPTETQWESQSGYKFSSLEQYMHVKGGFTNSVLQ